MGTKFITLRIGIGRKGQMSVKIYKTNVIIVNFLPNLTSLIIVILIGGDIDIHLSTTFLDRPNMIMLISQLSVANKIGTSF